MEHLGYMMGCKSEPPVETDDAQIEDTRAEADDPKIKDRQSDRGYKCRS